VCLRLKNKNEEKNKNNNNGFCLISKGLHACLPRNRGEGELQGGIRVDGRHRY